MPLRIEDKKWLAHRFGGSIRFDEPMSKHTSLRVGGPVDVFAVPGTVEELTVLVEWTWEKKIPYLTIGGGTNLLVTDKGVDGVILLLTRCLTEITRNREQNDLVRVTAEAGVRLPALCRYAIKNGLSGINFALGIPATVGGAIIMNAGTALGSMADLIEAVDIYQPDKGIQKLEADRLDFRYRSLSFEKVCDLKAHGLPIVFGGSFSFERKDPHQLQHEAEEILQNRKQREPTRYPSAGSFFKNPESGKTAGELIDLAGLKGRQIGGAKISVKHANYIVNRKNATAADILSLMQLIQETVQKQFGIGLEPEVRIIGH